MAKLQFIFEFILYWTDLSANMKIPLNDIQIIYEKLIAEINIAKVSVVMFTALDVDALCTLKIISVLHA